MFSPQGPGEVSAVMSRESNVFIPISLSFSLEASYIKEVEISKGLNMRVARSGKHVQPNGVACKL